MNELDTNKRYEYVVCELFEGFEGGYIENLR